MGAHENPHEDRTHRLGDHLDDRRVVAVGVVMKIHDTTLAAVAWLLFTVVLLVVLLAFAFGINPVTGELRP
jgi:hypothetical protein